MGDYFDTFEDIERKLGRYLIPEERDPDILLEVGKAELCHVIESVDGIIDNGDSPTYLVHAPCQDWDEQEWYEGLALTLLSGGHIRNYNFAHPDTGDLARFSKMFNMPFDGCSLDDLQDLVCTAISEVPDVDDAFCYGPREQILTDVVDAVDDHVGLDRDERAALRRVLSEDLGFWSDRAGIDDAVSDLTCHFALEVGTSDPMAEVLVTCMFVLHPDDWVIEGAHTRKEAVELLRTQQVGTALEWLCETQGTTLADVFSRHVGGWVHTDDFAVSVRDAIDSYACSVEPTSPALTVPCTLSSEQIFSVMAPDGVQGRLPMMLPAGTEIYLYDSTYGEGSSYPIKIMKPIKDIDPEMLGGHPCRHDILVPGIHTFDECFQPVPEIYTQDVRTSKTLEGRRH